MIELHNTLAKLTKFTPYVELHGDKPVSGTALTFSFNTGSEFLTLAHPELRATLYCKIGAKTHDLANQGAELPDLRFEKLKWPLVWRQKYDDSELTIHIGDREDDAIILPGSVKSPFKFTPMQGGTVVATLTFHCHPDSDAVGQIYHLQRNEVRISFEPGVEANDDDDEDDDQGDED